MMKLKNNRLEAVYTLLESGLITADIGTDHAFLPIALVLNDKAPFVYASDIRNGPLLKAEENIKKWNIPEDKIKTVLSDGLAELQNFPIAQIAIAGMGAENIIGILENSLLSKKAVLVLQPMNRIETLRTYLYEKGYRIEDEMLSLDQNKLYTIIKARYDGKVRELPKIEYLFIGGKLLQNKDPLLPQFFKKERSKQKKIFEGNRNKTDTEAIRKFTEAKEILEGIDRMEKEEL